MKNKIRHFLSLILVIVTVSFLAEPALAEAITFNFTGTITSVPSPPPYGLSISIGDPVTGRITYDTSFGSIQPPPSGMSVVIGGATVQSEGNASLQVLNNSFGIDNFNGYFTPISVNGVNQPSGSHAIGFSLTDSSQTVFSSTALPESLDINSFNSRQGFIFAGLGISVFFSIDTIEMASVAIPVSIDIKPGSFPSSIIPQSTGVIPVAILTTDTTDITGTFDATAVDSTTILFGSTGTEAAPVQHALEDVDGDGDTDLILHFNTQDTGIECGDTSATLTGETLDGQKFTGTDSIRTVPCK